MSIASAILSCIALCIITCLSVGLLFAYRMGLKDRQTIDKGQSLKPVVEKKAKPREETDEEKERKLQMQEIKDFMERGGKP